MPHYGAIDYKEFKLPTDSRHTQRVPGDVVKIRVDAQDVMSCIDAATAAGVALPGMSLSQIVKWGLVVAMQTMREAKLIPTRDGFEYQDMTRQYRSTTMGVKVNVGRGMAQQEVSMKIANRSVALDYKDYNSSYGVNEEDLEDSGLVLPPQVKSALNCGKQDLTVICTRVKDRDPNISELEVIKFLLLAAGRSAAAMFLPPEVITSAEQKIFTLWPEYPSVSEA